MGFSIKEMEKRTATIEEQRDSFKNSGNPYAAAVITEALALVAELAGRLDAAETLLADARKPKSARHYRRRDEEATP